MIELIDFEKLKIVNLEDASVEHIFLDLSISKKIDSFTIFEFMDFLKDSLKEIFEYSKNKDLKELFINIQTDLDEEDIYLIADNITGSFVSMNMIKLRTDREKRLGIPDNLNESLFMLANHIMDSINHELIIPIFNIAIYDKHNIERTNLIRKEE